MIRAAALLLALLLAACATRPPAYNRGWATFDTPEAAMLTYGVPESDDLDLFAVCDHEAKVFEVAFYTGDMRADVATGTRTELLIGPSGRPKSLMAAIEYSDLNGEMMVVARASLPPVFVADWAEQRIVIAGQGTAMTLLARPEKAMIATFLSRCDG